MSHIDPGPLATYESLADPHLTGYFNNSRMRRHLRKMGLITSRGNIVSEKVFRLNNSRKEHQRHIRDVLAQAIIHKALDMERHRQMHIKKQLEEIGKIERVRRVRAERALRGDEDVLPLLSPKAGTEKGKKKKDSHKKQKASILQAVTDSEDFEQQPQSVGYPAIPADTPYNTRTDRMKTPYPDVEVDNQHLHELDREALRSFTLNLSNFDLGSGVSPYSVPPLEGRPVEQRPQRRRPATAIATMGRRKNQVQRPRTNTRSLKLHRPEPPMMHRAQLHSLARVTFKYLGKMVSLDHEEEDPRDEVVVMQQHCGGENLRVFKGLLLKDDKFVIISRRHRTFPFSLTFYLNGVQVERLSTCCEYKHKKGVKLGAKSSHFGIVNIEGSQPCFKCLISQGKLKTRPIPTPPPEGKPRRKRKVKKLRGADERGADEYADDFNKSSGTTTTEDEVQHDAGNEDQTSISSESSDSSSTISDLSDTEDPDGGGDSSSDTDSKDRDDSSTFSDGSIEAPPKLVKPEKKPQKPKSPPPVPAKKDLPSPVKEKSTSTPPPPQVTEQGTTPSPSPVKEKSTSTPRPPQVTEQGTSPSLVPEKEDSKPSSPKASKPPSSVSSGSSDTSVDTADEVPNIIKPPTPKSPTTPKVSPHPAKPDNQTIEKLIPTPQVDPEKETRKQPTPPPQTLSILEPDKPPIRASTPIPMEEPVEIPERPRTPVPESSSSSSSSSGPESETESVKSNKSSDSQKDVEKIIRKDVTKKEKPEKKESSTKEQLPQKRPVSIISLIEGKDVADLSGEVLTERQVDEVVNFFQSNPSALNVREVNLKNCKLGDEAGKRILKSLQRNKTLKTLDLASNKLTENCIDIISDICQKSPIDHLSLENNPLQDGGCEKLVSSFTKSQETVVTAQLQKRVSQSLIASVLKDSRKELSGEYNNGMSSASSMSSLASTAVAETVALQSLNIAGTGAGEGTMETLGSYLALNPKLTHLDISNNKLTSNALECILTPFAEKTNRKLKSLWMNNASLTDKDAETIAEKLEERSLLTELSLKGNQITEDGKKKLVELSNSNKSLKTLHL